MFEKFESYLDKAGDGMADVRDLTPYFEQKARLLKERLFYYTGECDKLSEVHEIGKSSEYDPSADAWLDEDFLIAVFEEFLSDDYNPPAGNKTGLQVHLYALFVFYNFIRPGAGIHLDILLKLDIATVKILSLTTYVGAVIPDIIKRQNQKIAVTKKREKLAAENKEEIRIAFTDHLKAKWVGDVGDKKPILQDGKRYSVNRMATLLPMELTNTYDSRTIINHLKELRKDGKI